MDTTISGKKPLLSELATYEPTYHEDVLEDVSDTPKNILKRIRKAIDERLRAEPLKFGEPLRGPLHGFRKLRIGDYRVLYEVAKNGVRIWAIIHRKQVYPRVTVRRRGPFRTRPT